MSIDLVVATPTFLDLTFVGLEGLPAKGEERFAADDRHRPLLAERDDHALGAAREHGRGGLDVLLLRERERLALAHEQRARARELHGRTAGEGTCVVVAAGHVAGGAGRHAVELVETARDRARLEACDIRGARAYARVDGDHRAVSVDGHHDRGRCARTAALGQRDAVALGIPWPQ